ncbi:MAG: hypothetical protein JRJ00_00215 [Deltaproteobacteria bacterium]|nr:hypothetical protein [Deltaproteobacteria bacterium]
MPKRPNGLGLTANQQITLHEKAMSGDMVIVITPETVTPAPTAAAWTRNVKISLQSAAGEVHTWANLSEATILSIADDGGGTASIVTTTITLVNGEVVVVVSGTAATWANTETDTLTVGNMTIMGYTVTGGTSVETFTTP